MRFALETWSSGRYRQPASLARMAALAGVYVAFAVPALKLDAVSGFATLVWPPSAIALVALLRGGLHLWPGIALGAFLANVFKGAPPLVATGIAFGNTLEALVAAAAIRRLAGGEPSLGRLRDALSLVFVAAAGSTVLSASIGVASLTAGHIVPHSQVRTTWFAWWLGDAAADLVLGPLLLLRAREVWAALKSRSRVEVVALAAAVIICGWLVFGPSGLPPTHDSRQAYLLFPVMIGAAARMRQTGAAVASLVLSAIAIVGTSVGYGPFAGKTLHESLVELQGFMLIVAASGLLLGASKAELEANETKSKFLAKTGELLAGSLDYETTLEQVARLAVPYFADWCIVDVVDGQTIRRVAVAAANPEKEAILRRLRDHYPPDWSSPQPAGQALRTGKPYIMERFTPSSLAKTTRDDQHLDFIQRLDPRSAIALPLAVQDRIVGAITFAQSESRRQYDRGDLALGEEIARRAALAVDNARLHRASETARRLAEEQRTALEWIEKERVRLLERETTARAQAEQASRAKDEFLAMLGHELRNPLSPIVTAMQLMKLRGDGRALSREYEVIERQVRHLVRLVDDLLDVSRITRGKIALDRKPVEMAEVIAEAVEIAGPLLEQRKHMLDVDVPRQGLRVMGDRYRLAQVLANLLTNAAKYTPPEGRIRVLARPESGEACVRVVDNGVGLPPDLLPFLFDPFVQGPRSPDRAEGGLGIGLALVKSLVQLHGGTVSATSEGPDRGSEFVVRLPLFTEVAEATAPHAPTRAADAPTSRRVLLVDDNRDVAETTAEILREAGYAVTVAFDPAAALTAASETRPDIAILDVGLPVMDGYELARQIRERSGAAAPRFIALTGYGDEKDRARSDSAGFEGHLVKPVDFTTLVRAIEGRAP